MGDTNVYLSIFLVVLALIMFFIALYSFRYKNITGKNTFALLCLSVTIYSFGYAMELYSQSLDKIMFWNHMEYIGLPLIPALWLVFAFKYCEKEHLLTAKVYMLIFAVPVMTMVLRFTDSFHHLVYAKVMLYNNGFFNLIGIVKGPWYYVNFFYATLIELLSSFFYWRLAFRTNTKMRLQAMIMFFASVFPWISIIIITLFKTPYGIDIGPFTLTISSVLFLLGMFKYNFLNLRPIARDKVFEWSDDGIIILDSNHIIIDFNTSASNIIGILGSSSIGEKITDNLKDYGPVIDCIANSQETQLQIQNGEGDYYYSVKYHKIMDKRDDTIGYLILLHDITSHINSMERLNYIARTDELTGVFSRRYFTERSQNELARARRYNRPLSFIILDLDLFKSINDRFGHLGGDEVLKSISGICRETIRSTDLLGRFGGEEFIILMPETHIEDAFILAKRICRNIESSDIVYNSDKINVTASIGVTGTDSVEDEDLNTFFKSADQALYAAKADGRNCVRISILEKGSEGAASC